MLADLKWPYHFRRFFDAYRWLEKNVPKFADWNEQTRYVATIDLTDGYCYHPVQFREGVQDISVTPDHIRIDGKGVFVPCGETIIESEKRFGYEGPLSRLSGSPWYCPICGLFHMGGRVKPKDTGLGPRNRIRKMRALAAVAQEDEE
jgi:hypothetical protein